MNKLIELHPSTFHDHNAMRYGQDDSSSFWMRANRYKVSLGFAMRMGVRLTSFSLSAGIDWPFCVIAQVPLMRLQSKKDHW